MATPKPRVQYPQLKGSEQHHDLKNDPGKQGDPDHIKDQPVAANGKTNRTDEEADRR